jgi:hypothetical protein
MAELQKKKKKNAAADQNCKRTGINCSWFHNEIELALFLWAGKVGLTRNR